MLHFLEVAKSLLLLVYQPVVATTRLVSNESTINKSLRVDI